MHYIPKASGLGIIVSGDRKRPRVGGKQRIPPPEPIPSQGFDAVSTVMGFSESTFELGDQLAVASRGATGRRRWKTVAGGQEAIWPPKLESALLEGLTQLAARPPLPGGRTQLNRELSIFISSRTKKTRTPKQIASRLQNMKRSCQDPQLTVLPPCLSSSAEVSPVFVRVNLPGPWSQLDIPRVPSITVEPNGNQKLQDLTLQPWYQATSTEESRLPSFPGTFNIAIMPDWIIELETEWEVYVGEVLVHKDIGHIVKLSSPSSESHLYSAAFPIKVWAHMTKHNTELRSITAALRGVLKPTDLRQPIGFITRTLIFSLVTI
ncbi:hypothetical protein BKA70DRAFT_1461895 [Coprinopsis sp. MPI-PUGE-AT-0042]|nr:hypothetical protein BKA70DRAFT_1461895 [Coprinopsis sp. MPI-PUGE-AT-0042]